MVACEHTLMWVLKTASVDIRIDVRATDFPTLQLSMNVAQFLPVLLALLNMNPV